MRVVGELRGSGLRNLTRRAKDVASWMVLQGLLPARVVPAVSPYRKPPVSAADWEREYASGRWDYLREAPELPRYSVIAGYCRFFGPAERVLDIGCGEGLMADWLGTVGFGAYVGIDLSEKAVAAARGRGLPKTDFLVADAEAFEPDGRFDAIIFNEVLYFLDDPAAQLGRYSRALADGGVLVVSLYDSVAALRVWPLLRRGFETLDRVHVRHATKAAWQVAVLRPR